jgi:hypothetical protein
MDEIEKKQVWAKLKDHAKGLNCEWKDKEKAFKPLIKPETIPIISTPAQVPIQTPIQTTAPALTPTIPVAIPIQQTPDPIPEPTEQIPEPAPIVTQAQTVPVTAKCEFD